MKQAKARSTAILEYILYFALMILCSMAKSGPVRPFGIGVFVGLAYCRKNVWLLAPLLLAASLVGEFSWQSVALAGVCIVVVAVAYYLHYLFKKRMRLWHLLVYSFVSQMPVFFVYGMTQERLIAGALDLVLGTAFVLACAIVARRVLVKGLRYPATAKEDLAVGLVVTVVAMGLARIVVWNVSVGAVALGFAYLLAPRMLREKGVFWVIAAGLGAWAATGEVAHLALAAVWGVAGFVLRSRHPVFALLVLVGTDCIGGLVLHIYQDYNYLNTILFGVGGLALSLVPNKLRAKWENCPVREADVGVRYLVNRNRLDLYNKLMGLSTVLTDMRLVLEGGICDLPPVANNKNQLAKELSRTTCTKCTDRARCEHVLSASTAVAMYDLIARALELGRVNQLEAPAFFAENCRHIKDVTERCAELLDGYINKKQVADRVDENKRIMCEQLSGLSGMMADLAGEVKQVVSYDTTREKKLVEALSNRNIIAKECIIYHDKGLKTAVLVVRDKDVDNPELESTIDGHLGKMALKSVTNHSTGWVSRCYVSAPPLGVATGQYAATKKGSEHTGDTFSVLPLSTDKTLLAVCDGMGSGQEASGGANAAMALVESFYTAGLDDEAVLGLINKLLVVRNRDCFQALDICVVDLRRKHADFIKLGAPESVVRHAERIEVVEGGALPLGILENVTPKVTRVEIAEGDMIVMCSDGISECIGIEGVVRMAEQNPTNNPQTLARLTVEDALFVNEEDDKTVLCARIYENV